MSKELNCMNCSIGDFKHELCDCDNGFCKEFKSIGTQEDFFNAVIQRIRPQGEWITVSERLPSDGGNYLITVADLRLGHIGEHTVTMADFYAKEKKWNSIVDVVAWMPLPTPIQRR